MWIIGHIETQPKIRTSVTRLRNIEFVYLFETVSYMKSRLSHMKILARI